MLFSSLSQYLQKIESTPARLEKTVILAELFQYLAKEEQAKRSKLQNSDATQPEVLEIEYIPYLMQGTLLANYQSLEFQLSERMLLRALARYWAKNLPKENSPGGTLELFAEFQGSNEASEASFLSVLKKQYKKKGDIGDLFQEVLENKSEEDQVLTVRQVYDKLESIALVSGLGAQENKLQLLEELLQGIDPLSGKYISRIILGKMRLGFSTMTILDALSWAKVGTKADSQTLEAIFQRKADLGKLARSYLVDHADLPAVELLKKTQLELGIPVVAALCQRLNSSEEIVEKMGKVLAEPKYDGLRIQIHFSRKGFKNGLHYQAFTRNLDNVTKMFPELEKLGDWLDCQSAILDSEAIAVDKKTGKFLAFQETIQRKRKYDIAAKAEELPIRFLVFDILSLDGESLIDQGLEERKAKLRQVLKDSPLAEKTKYLSTDRADLLRQFHEKQLGIGLEGAVMKKSGSPYISGRKGWRWVKIKEEEGSRGKLADTLDCVMMGYYFGKGKRNQFGIGALLVGVLAEEGKVRTVAKIGTGLTDEQFREIKKLADKYQSPTNQIPANYLCPKSLRPDVCIDPQIVLEVAADEITQSPTHSAGVALRFPRLIRIRYDKSWEDATQLAELNSMQI